MTEIFAIIGVLATAVILVMALFVSGFLFLRSSDIALKALIAEDTETVDTGTIPFSRKV